MTPNVKPIPAVLFVGGLAAILAYAQFPPGRPALAQLTTNASGALEWIVPTNAPVAPAAVVPQPRSGFLSPGETSRVLVSLLDAHMAAAEHGWTPREVAADRFRELETKLVEVLVYAPLSDLERETMTSEARLLRETVADQAQVIRQMESDQTRMRVEIERLRRLSPKQEK